MQEENRRCNFGASAAWVLTWLNIPFSLCEAVPELRGPCGANVEPCTAAEVFEAWGEDGCGSEGIDSLAFPFPFIPLKKSEKLLSLRAFPCFLIALGGSSINVTGFTPC